MVGARVRGAGWVNVRSRVAKGQEMPRPGPRVLGLSGKGLRARVKGTVGEGIPASERNVGWRSMVPACGRGS